MFKNMAESNTKNPEISTHNQVQNEIVRHEYLRREFSTEFGLTAELNSQM